MRAHILVMCAWILWKEVAGEWTTFIPDSNANKGIEVPRQFIYMNAFEHEPMCRHLAADYNNQEIVAKLQDSTYKLKRYFRCLPDSIPPEKIAPLR